MTAVSVKASPPSITSATSSYFGLFRDKGDRYKWRSTRFTSGRRFFSLLVPRSKKLGPGATTVFHFLTFNPFLLTPLRLPQDGLALEFLLMFSSIRFVNIQQWSLILIALTASLLNCTLASAIPLRTRGRTLSTPGWVTLPLKRFQTTRTNVHPQLVGRFYRILCMHA